MDDPDSPDLCYCRARPRYSAVELDLRPNGYALVLTLAEHMPWIATINTTELSTEEALTQIERGQHYLHSTDPQIHRSVPVGDPVATRLLEVAALRSRAGM